MVKSGVNILYCAAETMSIRQYITSYRLEVQTACVQRSVSMLRIVYLRLLGILSLAPAQA